MLFEQFRADCTSFWDHYLRMILEAAQHGRVVGDARMLYPTLVVYTETSEQFVMELYGASKTYVPLKQKRQRSEDLREYFTLFGPYTDRALFNFNAANNSIRQLCLAHEADFDAAQLRFPYLDIYLSKLVLDESASLIAFGKDFRNAHFERCAFLSRKDDIYRCKQTLMCVVVSRTTTRGELRDVLRQITEDGNSRGRRRVCGLHMVGRDEVDAIYQAAQLQSLFLSNGVRETTIGDFINSHPDIIRSAFNTDVFHYEPYLPWVEHDGTVNDEAINPDLLIRRIDGFYDIIDLKLAALDKRSLTKGERKRRRFVDYVSEGIAQLANYEEYFRYSKNRKAAERKYGIVLREPRLTLVVGSIENSDVGEITQALRPYKNISLIDYDTLTSIFLGRAQSRVEGQMTQELVSSDLSVSDLPE